MGFWNFYRWLSLVPKEYHTLPRTPHDRFAPTELALHEAEQLQESYAFMWRRDRLLGMFSQLRGLLDVDRVRLYEYIPHGASGPLFRGLVEVGGVYGNFSKIELPLSADWYSRYTVEHNRPFEPVLYPPSDVKPEPPRYLPYTFWRERHPERWADILLVDGGRIVGKLTIDNYFNKDKVLPDKLGSAQTAVERLVPEFRSTPPAAETNIAVEAHRRRVLLNDLTEVLGVMVATLKLDRARAYEYNPRDRRFEARAEIGGTADPLFASFEKCFDLSSARDDPISFLTYELRKIGVYKRDHTLEFDSQDGKDSIQTKFKCDEIVGSSGLKYLMDIPLKFPEGTIIGKITVDNKHSDLESTGKMLETLLKKKREEIDRFAGMAATAIIRANSLATAFGWLDRVVLMHKGLSQRTWTIIVAIIVAVVTGLVTGLIGCLFGR